MTPKKVCAAHQENLKVYFITPDASDKESTTNLGLFGKTLLRFLKFLSRIDLINQVVCVPSMPCVTCLVGDLRHDQQMVHVYLATHRKECHLQLEFATP